MVKEMVKILFPATKNIDEVVGIIEKYRMKFTDAEKVAFTKVQSVGVPMNQLKGYLNLSDDDRKAFKSQTGIPLDSTNTQLIDWVEQSLAVNPDYKLAIKGDAETKYPKVKALFEGLRDIDFLKFWLITSQEVAQ